MKSTDYSDTNGSDWNASCEARMVSRGTRQNKAEVILFTRIKTKGSYTNLSIEEMANSKNGAK